MRSFFAVAVMFLLAASAAVAQIDTSFFLDLPPDAELKLHGMPTRDDMRRTMRELKGIKHDLDSGWHAGIQNLDDTVHFFQRDEDEEDLPRTLEEKILRPTGIHILFIDLKAHPIEKLPDGFDNLTDLEFLVIENLPEGAHFDFDDAFNTFARISGLRDLYIINNGSGFRAIPSSIGGISSLKRFTCYNNTIVSIPPEVRKLDSLESFSLEHNSITTLPPLFAELSKLKKLGLEKNAIPPADCAALQLSLPDCKITYTGGR
jgi:hypothetical protein